MRVAVDHTGDINVSIWYLFTNATELAEKFPELKMDFEQFPTATSDGSQVELSVGVKSKYQFDNLQQFETRLPKMFLHFDVLKDSEPIGQNSGLTFGGVTPRIIIQAEEEPLMIEPDSSNKKDGG